MIATRRDIAETSDARNDARMKLGLLDRPQNASFNEVVDFEEQPKVMTESEDRERMSNNFDILLNYEKYIEEAKRQEKAEMAKAAVIEEFDSTAAPVVEEIKAEVVEDENLIPSKTTSQFGPAEISNVYSDMKQMSKNESKYRINTHGKLMVALYAIVVTVIMALIIINTSVLAGLKQATARKSGELALLTEEYNQLVEEYNQISSDEYVIDKATNEYNMVK